MAASLGRSGAEGFTINTSKPLRFDISIDSGGMIVIMTA